MKLKTPGVIQTRGYPILGTCRMQREQSSQICPQGHFGSKAVAAVWPPGGSDSPVAAAVFDLGEWARGGAGEQHTLGGCWEFHLNSCSCAAATLGGKDVWRSGSCLFPWSLPWLTEFRDLSLFPAVLPAVAEQPVLSSST